MYVNINTGINIIENKYKNKKKNKKKKNTTATIRITQFNSV